MPINTLPEMVLGFAVILGILLVYVLTLIIRIRKTKSRLQQSRKK